MKFIVIYILKITYCCIKQVIHKKRILIDGFDQGVINYCNDNSLMNQY